MVMVRTNQPPSGGCLAALQLNVYWRTSRLRAAVWLHYRRRRYPYGCAASRLRAAVWLHAMVEITGQIFKPSRLRAAVWLHVKKRNHCKIRPRQPPSGGCLAARHQLSKHAAASIPAAFGRLSGCTTLLDRGVCSMVSQPPSGGCLAARGAKYPK